MPPTDLVRPPSDIRLQCTVHTDFVSGGWTEAWNHQLDVHAGDQTLGWNLLGTVPQ